MTHTARHALRKALVRRLARNSVVVVALLAGALAAGAAGYRVFEGLDWLDALLNAAMILTGMGPAQPLTHPRAKVFAIAYSLFSAVFFLSLMALLLAPALHHFLHVFHLELDERKSRLGE
jgi:hypothetical protein